ncbi:cupin domain-containing protein [Xenorhabdus sp. TS4]|uniref:cupin domain-containing protein n=1 Tax=Xenorhabdus sp. TS4 TaxID=1873483 RepID=UPI001CA40C0A|nr:cupin domain-containing protein [Xenorhabdus sp. TS4]
MMTINFNIEKKYFLDNFFEKKPYVFKGIYDVNFINRSEIEDIYNRSDLESFEGLKLMYNGILDKREYLESYQDLGNTRYRYIYSKLYDYLNAGATLVANGIINEPKIDYLAKCCSSLTDSHTFSSIYLSYGEKSSFKPHWDSRDIFVIQLTGKKRWVIYEPSFQNPLYVHQSKDMEDIYPCPSEPYDDFVLEAGDVLYLPRGWWHNPLPVGEETIHLSVGIFPPYVFNYLYWLSNKINDFEIGRKSLPRSWVQAKSEIEDLSKFIFKYLGSEEAYNEFLQSIGSEQRIPNKLNLDLFCNNKSKLSDKAYLRINSNNNLSIDDGYVICNGIKLNLDHRSTELLKKIDDNPYISLKKLLSFFETEMHEKMKELIYNLGYQNILEIINDL